MDEAGGTRKRMGPEDGQKAVRRRVKELADARDMRTKLDPAASEAERKSVEKGIADAEEKLRSCKAKVEHTKMAEEAALLATKNARARWADLEDCSDLEDLDEWQG